MRKLLKITGAIVGKIVRLAYAGAGILVILALALLLGGHLYLTGVDVGLPGTDLGNYLSFLTWIDKYFPRVPFWYPLEGGGVSISHGYQIFSHWLIAGFSQLTGYDLIQSVRIWGVASVVSMALGIYTFVWWRLKSQTGGLLAAIFYLLSPMAWTWLFDWGMYAEAVSYVFLPWAVVFFDAYLTEVVNQGWGGKTRLYLLLTGGFFALAAMTHFGAVPALMGIYLVYGLAFLIKAKSKRRSWLRIGLGVGLSLVAGVGLALFVLLPYQNYNRIANRAGLSGSSNLQALSEGTPIRAAVLGFYSIPKDDFAYAMRHLAFPAAVTILAVLGLGWSWRKRNTLSLALYSVVALGISLAPEITYESRKFIPWVFTYPFYWRYCFIGLRIAWPILAAWGVVSLTDFPLSLVKNRAVKVVRFLVVPIVAVGISGWLVWSLKNWPEKSPGLINYGARGISWESVWRGRVSDQCRQANNPLQNPLCLSELSKYFSVSEFLRICNLNGNRHPFCEDNQPATQAVVSFWQQCNRGLNSPWCGASYQPLSQQLSWPQWQKQIYVSSEVDQATQLKQILDGVERENPQARLDFSPYRSGYSMWAPYYNGRLSQMHAYTATLLLMHRFYGYQSTVFYLNDPQYQDPKMINDLADWFGINYVFLNSMTDTELFQQAGWQEWPGGKDVWKYPEANPLLEWTTKPKVLVISKFDIRGYDQIFTLANMGMAPFEKSYLIEGKGTIDDYTLKDLQPYDVVVLHGYDYKSRAKAWKLIADYVNQGGNLLVETGWQYTAPDWQAEAAPEVLPLTKLEWMDLGQSGNFVLENSEIGGAVDTNQFFPLVWEGQSWKVSTSGKENLKDWAEVVVSWKNYPLVAAGRYGQGKVVWSGMNLFAHARQREKISQEEIKLLGNLLSWLGLEKEVQKYAISYQRGDPDEVVFYPQEASSEPGTIVWKEAWYRDFKPVLIENSEEEAELSSVRGGPGITVINVPPLTPGERISLKYVTPLGERLAKIVSIGVGIGLVVILIEGWIRGEQSWVSKGLTALEGKGGAAGGQVPGWGAISNWWKKDEEEE
jgi:hypothetical protein